MPKVVIIQGASGSGKTTLSHELKSRLEEPVFLNKDAIKEFLYDTQPTGDREWSRILGRASIAAMYAMAEQFLAAGKDVIIESAFVAEHARGDVAALGASVLELYCRCDEQVRQSRLYERASGNTSRHPGHFDSENLTTDVSTYEALGVGKVIEIDTTDIISDEKIVEITDEVTKFLGEGK